MKFRNLILVLGLLANTAYGQSLLSNGSFEDGPFATSSGFTTGVTTSCNLTGSVSGPTDWYALSFTTPDRVVHNTYFCHWDAITAADGEAWTVLAQEETEGSDLIYALIPDQTYEFKCWLRSESFRNTVSAGSVFMVYFWGPTFTCNELQAPIVDYTQWSLFDTIFTATGACTKIEFKSYVKATDVDGASLELVNPLPIELLYFRTDGTEVSWATAAESNTDYFSVLDNDSEIAHVEAAGNSTHERYYKTELRPIPGINYLQLRTVDRDGKGQRSKKIIFYYDPNRKHNIFELYNILGQLIK